MPKFLIEVPHEPDTVACARVAKMFLESGSHFLTHAEWGCMDGVHSAWMMVEMDSKADALAIVPPGMRHDAKVTQLTQFKLGAVERTLARHQTTDGPQDERRG